MSTGPSGEHSSKKRKTLHRPELQELSQPSRSSQQSELQHPRSQLQSQPSNASQCKKPKGVRNEGLRKNKAADWFLRNAPKAIEWRKRQRELELNTVEQYVEVIQALTGRTNIVPKRKPLPEDRQSENEVVDLTERFALIKRDSLKNAKLQRSIATFQALILLSYCEVLRKRGVPYRTVDRIIQPITSREIDRRRLLSSALWVNGVIVHLVSHGWTVYRATELFFISGSPSSS